MGTGEKIKTKTKRVQELLSSVPRRDDHGQGHAAQRDGCRPKEPLPGDGLQRGQGQHGGDGDSRVGTSSPNNAAPKRPRAAFAPPNPVPCAPHLLGDPKALLCPPPVGMPAPPLTQGSLSLHLTGALPALGLPSIFLYISVSTVFWSACFFTSLESSAWMVWGGGKKTQHGGDQRRGAGIGVPAAPCSSSEGLILPHPPDPAPFPCAEHHSRFPACSRATAPSLPIQSHVLGLQIPLFLPKPGSERVAIAHGHPPEPPLAGSSERSPGLRAGSRKRIFPSN